MQLITEGTACVEVTLQKIVDRTMEVFYNPMMKLNRDISVLVLNNYNLGEGKLWKIALPLAGSGIRAIRFLKETEKEKICEIHVNDKKEKYDSYIKKMLKLNNLENERVITHNKDANLFLLENKPFDYIDIDPFGTPNPFLDSAVRALRSEGVLAVTATDTSALCGTYPKACMRKYWAKPLRNELMHEIGLRILIRKVQLIGMHHQRALIPVLSYAKDHYMRIFFRFDKGKPNMDKVLEQHAFYLPGGEQEIEHSSQNVVVGPVWMGELNDLALLKKIQINYDSEHISKRTRKLIDTLVSETQVGGFGFFDIHKLAKEKVSSIPNFEKIIEKLKEKGFVASRVHFRDTAIKTNATKKDVEELIK